MKWKVDTVKSFKRKKINGESYIRLDDVLELLERSCDHCEYYEEIFVEHPVSKRKNIRYICKNVAMNIRGNAERGWKYVVKSNDACKRFKKKSEDT